MPAKDWLIVSVRMYVPAISATPSAIAIAVSSDPQLALHKASEHELEHSAHRLHQVQRLLGRDRIAVVHDAPVGEQ